MHNFNGRILVTGGAGFIGSSLVWALNKRGYSNIVISDFLGEDEKWRNLVPLKYSDYIDGGVFRAGIARNVDAFGKFSCVFHLGACSATTEKNASYLIDNNFNYTKELATWALAQGARFIYASSAATYGDGAQGMADGIDDLHALRPLNMYGYSKHLFDIYAKTHGMFPRIVGLKYFNVFGPNENHKGDMRSLVNKAFQQIQATGRVQLFKSHRSDFKDGEQMRDFLYVKDAIEMTIHFAEKATNAGGLYNLGSGEANTWRTLAGAIFHALKLPEKIDFIDIPEVIRGKYQYYTKADISALRATGYAKSMTPLVDSVQDYVINYLSTDKRLGA